MLEHDQNKKWEEDNPAFMNIQYNYLLQTAFKVSLYFYRLIYFSDLQLVMQVTCRTPLTNTFSCVRDWPMVNHVRDNVSSWSWLPHAVLLSCMFPRKVSDIRNNEGICFKCTSNIQLSGSWIPRNTVGWTETWRLRHVSGALQNADPLGN